jgi:hypothetical protein
MSRSTEPASWHETPLYYNIYFMSALDASHVPVELSEKHHVQGYGGQSQGWMLCVNTGAVVPK